MVESKEFQLWLRRTLGYQMAVEAEASRYSLVPADEVKIEVRHHGRWVEVSEGELHG